MNKLNIFLTLTSFEIFYIKWFLIYICDVQEDTWVNSFLLNLEFIQFHFSSRPKSCIKYGQKEGSAWFWHSDLLLYRLPTTSLHIRKLDLVVPISRSCLNYLFKLEIYCIELGGINDERRDPNLFINPSEIIEALWAFSMSFGFVFSLIHPSEQDLSSCVTKVYTLTTRLLRWGEWRFVKNIAVFS